MQLHAYIRIIINEIITSYDNELGDLEKEIHISLKIKLESECEDLKFRYIKKCNFLITSAFVLPNIFTYLGKNLPEGRGSGNFAQGLTVKNDKVNYLLVHRIIF